MFTGEMVDANDLVYLRARYYVPELGVFPSLDPLENLNAYQYVNGNPANSTDPSGQGDVGCLDQKCPEIESMLGRLINEIMNRIHALKLDKCCLYEDFLKEAGRASEALPCTRDSSCLDANNSLRPDIGTWQGHQDQLRDKQGSLRDWLNCYKWRNSNAGRYDGPCPNNTSLVEGATAVANAQAPASSDLHPELTLPASLPVGPTVERVPEPAPPYGRGTSVPTRGDHIPLWNDVAYIGAVAMCIPIVVGAAIVAPEIIITGSAFCATNPGMCVTAGGAIGGAIAP